MAMVSYNTAEGPIVASVDLGAKTNGNSIWVQLLVMLSRQ